MLCDLLCFVLHPHPPSPPRVGFGGVGVWGRGVKRNTPKTQHTTQKTALTPNSKHTFFNRAFDPHPRLPPNPYFLSRVVGPPPQNKTQQSYLLCWFPLDNQHTKQYCALFVVCYLLVVVCCLLFVVCCLLFVICCLGPPRTNSRCKQYVLQH